MKLIKPFFKILSNIDGVEILRNIERAGRTCYKSEDKITAESSLQMIKMLIARGHESVLEHQSFSVLFVCDRGVSHEIVRHRLASFSQESTRYCNYSNDKFGNQLTFIIPVWCNIEPSEWTHEQAIKSNNLNDDLNALLWLQQMSWSERVYNKLTKEGWQPQQARSILPNSLKTEIVVTANLREWRTIFKQRTATVAHPQMRELMCPLLDKMKTLISIVFDDIIY